MAVVGLAGPAGAQPCADVPSVRDVRTQARRHAGLDEIPRWRGRARAAALLPWLTLRAARGLDWDDGPAARATVPEVNHDVVYEARMTWRLDRLIYEPAEPRLLDGERTARRARATLDEDVTKLYFRWRRAEQAVAARIAAGEPAEPRLTLDAEEALALLDARTGGWLGERVGCRR